MNILKWLLQGWRSTLLWYGGFMLFMILLAKFAFDQQQVTMQPQIATYQQAYNLAKQCLAQRQDPKQCSAELQAEREAALKAGL